MSGVQVNKMQVVQRGEGKVEIEGGQLKPGIYLYSLFADDVEVGTKRMVLTK